MTTHMTTYTVQPGDTLGTIAKRFYGDAGRYIDIAGANAIEDPDHVNAGMVLDIPEVEPLDPLSLEESLSEAPAGGEAVMFSEGQLKQIMPNATSHNISKYVHSLNQHMASFGVVTPLRAAHFIAQIAHESGSFRFNQENLNYSAKALRLVFGKYFPSDELAQAYARQPEKIANRVYGNRMGNGPEESGDGWKYRGRGLIQLTGFDNYSRCGEALGLDLTGHPDQVADDPDVSIMAVGWFWQTNKLNSLADADDVKAVTKRINGGYHGLDDRMAFLERAKNVLC